MDDLTILEQESFKILKQLEYCCDSAKLRNLEVRQEIIKHKQNHYEDDVGALNLALLKQKKFLVIPYSEIDFSVLKKHKDIHDVANFLQENGVPFHLSLDFIFDDPTRLEVSENPDDIYSELGIINGESIEEIKTSIQKLIKKLSPVKITEKQKMTQPISINIGEINQLELLEDKEERKKITVYINIQYGNPKSYNRRKSWGKMYELAKEQETSYNKGFFDYFNSNKTNPLYSKEGFKVTKILKQENGTIVPNIKIDLITQGKVTRRLKSA
ncbi:MAG: hypothetical protein WCP17_03040 [bacterium]